MITIKHISLNVADEIKKILPVTLEKDLQDDEIICPVCHGLGILKQDYRFGVKEDDTEKAFKLNWYDNEYLTLCPNFYFGRIMSIDADWIIENACEELHEDARDSIGSKDEKELQKFLDKWCDKQTGTTTYYPCYKDYVSVMKVGFD